MPGKQKPGLLPWLLKRSRPDRPRRQTQPTVAGPTALILACSAERGNIEAVEMPLERGPDLNVTNERGDTALWKASLNGHLDIVKLLVEKGADLNVRARDALTALGRALKSGHDDIVKFLKAHGAKE